ncbi:MAG: hypothetical protein HY279_02200 [Nitrospinae bacterium]|nr:hypothetical protein [Nitrospinota bacterium]
MKLKALIFLIIIILISVNTSVYSQDKEVKLKDNEYNASESCAECHLDIYNKWKDSVHAMSVDDPIFYTSYIEAYTISSGQAKTLCLKCHAPTVLVTKDYELKNRLSREGVSCDFCHTLKGVKLNDRRDPFMRDISPVKRGPLDAVKVEGHKIEYSKLHLSSELCAACHEYVSDNGLSIMGTYSEWKASSYAAEGKQCQNCHMPRIEGEISKTSNQKRIINDHNLQGGHYIVQLKKTQLVKIKEIKRLKDGVSVSVSVENAGSGHMVPTGIPTRKLILNCEVRTVKNKVFNDKRVFEKIIAGKNGEEMVKDSEIMLGMGAAIAKDNRIGPKEVRVEEFIFGIPGNTDISVSAWVDYLYKPLLLHETEMKIEMNRDEKTVSR